MKLGKVHDIGMCAYVNAQCKSLVTFRRKSEPPGIRLCGLRVIMVNFRLVLITKVVRATMHQKIPVLHSLPVVWLTSDDALIMPFYKTTPSLLIQTEFVHIPESFESIIILVCFVQQVPYGEGFTSSLRTEIKPHFHKRY